MQKQQLIQKPPAAPADTISIIVLGMTVVGNCKCEGSIRIEGRVEGSVESGKSIVIGKDAVVTGDITAEDAVIFGRTEGRLVRASRVELHASSDVNGEIETRRLVIEEGATVNAAVKMSRGGSQLSSVAALNPRGCKNRNTQAMSDDLKERVLAAVTIDPPFFHALGKGWSHEGLRVEGGYAERRYGLGTPDEARRPDSRGLYPVRRRRRAGDYVLHRPGLGAENRASRVRRDDRAGPGAARVGRRTPEGTMTRGVVTVLVRKKQSGYKPGDVLHRGASRPVGRASAGDKFQRKHGNIGQGEGCAAWRSRRNRLVQQRTGRVIT